MFCVCNNLDNLSSQLVASEPLTLISDIRLLFNSIFIRYCDFKWIISAFIFTSYNTVAAIKPRVINELISNNIGKIKSIVASLIFTS